MRIAINQPYFIPYAGFFRLFAATDLFVIYDCVQFTRRGYVHRNKLTDQNGNPQWLTLPIKKCPQKTNIKDLKFNGQLTQEQFDKFPIFEISSVNLVNEMIAESLIIRTGVVEYITNLLRLACDILGIPFNVVRSSELNIPDSLRGEERILAVCKAVGATEYVNASGGRGLYDVKNFAKQGVSLKFLPDYTGNYISILERLITEDKNNLKNEIYAQL